MARARNIKPGFYLNEELAGCSLMARYIFPGIWMLADREGRLEDRPLRIKAAILPYDDANVSNLLDELEKAEMIFRYESGNCRYIQINNFKKHQTPHCKEAESTIPAPCKHSASTVQVQDKHSESTGAAPPDILNPDSLIPDSLNLIAPPAGGEAAAPRSKPKRASAYPVDFYPDETGQQIANQGGISIPIELERFRDYHLARGSTMKDWQAAWRTWARNSLKFSRAPTSNARASPRDIREAEGKRVIDVLTGSRRNERSERDITGEAVRLAG